MSSFALVVYYMVKEAVNPRLHHVNFQEFIEYSRTFPDLFISPSLFY